MTAVSGRRPLLLTLRPLGLESLLTAVPDLRALRRAFPGHHHVLAAPVGLAPLARLCDAVDDVHDTQPLVPIRGLSEPVDIAVDLHGCSPDSQRLLAALRPRRLIAFRHALVAETAGGATWLEDEHEATRWCRMLETAGVPADASDILLPVPDVPEVARWDGCAVVHPGAAGGAPRWPPDRFGAVAALLEAAGEFVVVTGSAAEVGLAETVAREAGLGGDRVLAGRTSVLALAGVVAASRRVVSAATEVAHLASAFAVPSVSLFGPAPPAWWGPPAGRRHRVLGDGRCGDDGGPLGEESSAIGVDAVVDELAALDALEDAGLLTDRLLPVRRVPSPSPLLPVRPTPFTPQEITV